MTVLVSEIIQKGRYLTMDVAGVRWDDNECIGWLNDGIKDALFHKPTAYVVNGAIPLVSGIRQSLPAGGLALLDITHNTSGNACTLISRTDLSHVAPAWPTEPQVAAAEHYMTDPDDPKTFLVYPPNNGTGELQGRYSALPTALAATSDAIPLADEYSPVLLNYLLYRTWSKHTNVRYAMERAEMEYNKFLTSLGVKIQAQVQYSPRRRQQEDMDSPN